MVVHKQMNVALCESVWDIRAKTLGSVIVITFINGCIDSGNVGKQVRSTVNAYWKVLLRTSALLVGVVAIPSGGYSTLIPV